MNRDTRAAIAQQTLNIIADRIYRLPSGESVDIGRSLGQAMQATRLYRPEDFPATIEKVTGSAQNDMTVEVTGETTLEAAARIAEECIAPDPLCLNFASAKNPGGGFLSGSQAQEESLARSSGLYACLMEQQEMYEYNRKLGSTLYSDHMIYSPNVPVFRSDDGDLLAKPYTVSILTAPAVNAGAVASNEPEKVDRIEPVMEKRLERLLWVAAQHGHKVLVLGAWGCGVFRNDPSMIAGLFRKALGPGGAFAGRFERVIYAVYDRAPGEPVLSAFRRTLE